MMHPRRKKQLIRDWIISAIALALTAGVFWVAHIW